MMHDETIARLRARKELINRRINQAVKRKNADDRRDTRMARHGVGRWVIEAAAEADSTARDLITRFVAQADERDRNLLKRVCDWMALPSVDGADRADRDPVPQDDITIGEIDD